MQIAIIGCNYEIVMIIIMGDIIAINILDDDNNA